MKATTTTTSPPPETASPSLPDRLGDRLWRLENLYYIKDKHGKMVKLKLNRVQKVLLQNLHTRNIILKARQLGMCLDPETRVLTEDLRWIRLEDVQVGQRLVSVDENRPNGRGCGRKMRQAIVEGKREVFEPAFKIKMDNGVEVISTAPHRFLMKKRGGTDTVWRTIADAKVGDEIRYITKPWAEPTVEDGWFGGMLDGEGSLALKNRAGASVCVAQVEGPVWNRLLDYVRLKGYDFRIEWDRRKKGESSKFGDKPVGKVVFGKMNQIFQVLGQTRPTRFLERLWWEGKDLPGKRSGEAWSKIVSIEAVGKRRMIDLQTDTKTFIAEGLVSHNSTFIAILFLDHCLFHKNISAAIVADKIENGKNIFKKIDFAWEKFPEELKEFLRITSNSDSSSEMSWSNGSTFKVGTTLHSGTHQLLHVSEYGPLCKQSPEKAEDIKKSALPTVPDDGGLVFIESTGEGEGNDFHQMCLDAIGQHEARKPLSHMDYKFFFFPWYEDDSYEVKDAPAYPASLDRYFNDLEKQKGIKLPQPKRNWYSLKLKALKERMKEQYPSTPDEAFLSSGNKQFNPEILDQKMKNEVLEPVDVDGDLIIYRRFKRGHLYALGADVADGVGLDSSTMCVIDFTTNEVVATYRSNEIDPVNFAYDLARVGNMYGTCIIAPESNRTGHTTCVKLAEMYPHVYQFELKGYVLPRQTIRLGWSTTVSTKPRMMANLKTVFEDEENPLLVRDPAILREARLYSKDDSMQVTNAQVLKTTRHFDLLIATAIANEMRSFATSGAMGTPKAKAHIERLRELTASGKRRFR